MRNNLGKAYSGGCITCFVVYLIQIHLYQMLSYHPEGISLCYSLLDYFKYDCLYIAIMKLLMKLVLWNDNVTESHEMLCVFQAVIPNVPVTRAWILVSVWSTTLTTGVTVPTHHTEDGSVEEVSTWNRSVHQSLTEPIIFWLLFWCQLYKCALFRKFWKWSQINKNLFLLFYELQN